MTLSRIPSIIVSLAACSLTAIGCSGIVVPEPPGAGGTPGDGGSAPPSGSGSSSGGGGGSTSSSSSGGVTPPPCAGLEIPAIARVCPDGTSVGGTYVVKNGSCVLEYICPPPPPIVDAGCFETVLCVTGDHWDMASCKCVPDACAPLPCPSGHDFDPTTCSCAASSCQTAADCTGPLPQVCLICDGGGLGCAHYSCVTGECQLTYCN